ncbi:MAG: hypothetical protein M5U19_14485 [Microthrixaceae bacterium]|nr:hypothetical protein [Microthrixaceae bacterium]
MHNEVEDAHSHAKERPAFSVPLANLRQSVTSAIDRARTLSALLAHSSSVRRGLLGRVLAATLCTCLALWAARTLSDAADVRASWGPQVTVLMARHDLPAGKKVSASDTITGTRPVSLTPSDALRDLPPGATTTAVILAGEPLVRQRMTDDESRLAPPDTTAIRLELAVGAPELEPSDRVDVLGPGDGSGSAGEDQGSTSQDPTGAQVVVISREAVVLRPPTDDDPSIEVAVDDTDVATVAEAALTGGVAVVRRSG